MKSYLQKYWFSLSIVIIFAVAAIVFLVLNQETLGLICLINTVIYGFGIRFDMQDEKEKKQSLLIETLQRKVEALDEYVQALAERENLDYEYLKQRDDIIAETVKKIETERRD